MKNTYAQCKKTALVKRLTLVGLAVALSTPALGAEKGDADAARGFYYDAKTNRYFSDGRSSFMIRPVEDSRYLERIEVSLDDSEFQVYQGKLQFKTEGLHQIRFRALDPVLNWSPLQDFRIYVDLTPPLSSANWQGPNFQGEKMTYVSPQSRLSIFAQDNLSGVSKVLWAEKGGTIVFPGQAQFKGEGEHTVRFAAVDNVGNQEVWHDMSFYVDSKAPVTKATINGQTFQTPNGLYVNSGSQVALAATDDGSGVSEIEYQTNGGPTTLYRNPIPVTETKTELKYRAVDRVGNQEAWKTMTLLQDTAPPALAIERQGNHVAMGGRIYANPGFTILANAKDGESGISEFSFSYDGKTFQKSTTNKLVFSSPGEFHFIAKAIDRVGNVSEANPMIVIIDNQPPKTLLRANNKLVQKDGIFLSPIPNQIEFMADDQGVGVEKIEVSYDGKTYSVLNGPIDLAQWTTSKRTIFYRSVDRLGNREPAQSMTVQVRSEGPKVDLVVESENLPDVPLSAIKKRGLSSVQGQEQKGHSH